MKNNIPEIVVHATVDAALAAAEHLPASVYVTERVLGTVNEAPASALEVALRWAIRVDRQIHVRNPGTSQPIFTVSPAGGIIVHP